MNSWCSRWALLMSATVGAAIAARVAFPGVVHSQLHHRRVMVPAQFQQRQRQADVVVKVPLVRERVRLAEMRAQDRRDHLLDRRFPLSRRPPPGECQSPAPMRGEPPERKTRAFHDEKRQFSPGCSGFWTIAAAAPRSFAAPMNRCPSKRSPLRATNSAPRCNVRLSVETESKRTSSR